MIYPVSENKINDLKLRMEKLGIRESDIVEDFVRGSGAGGQKINKTSSTVLITHVPTQTQVRCQESRQQSLNRFIARRLLVEKLEAQIYGERSLERQRIEKIRRQKRKRSKRAKEKMLANKKHRKEIKSFRQKPTHFD